MSGASGSPPSRLRDQAVVAEETVDAATASEATTGAKEEGWMIDSGTEKFEERF